MRTSNENKKTVSLLLRIAMRKNYETLKKKASNSINVKITFLNQNRISLVFDINRFFVNITHMNKYNYRCIFANVLLSLSLNGHYSVAEMQRSVCLFLLFSVRKRVRFSHFYFGSTYCKSCSAENNHEKAYSSNID